jgi:hypothetical protein
MSSATQEQDTALVWGLWNVKELVFSLFLIPPSSLRLVSSSYPVPLTTRSSFLFYFFEFPSKLYGRPLMCALPSFWLIWINWKKRLVATQWTRLSPSKGKNNNWWIWVVINLLFRQVQLNKKKGKKICTVTSRNMEPSSGERITL